jgi:hypothetical protein
MEHSSEENTQNGVWKVKIMDHIKNEGMIKEIW